MNRLALSLFALVLALLALAGLLGLGLEPAFGLVGWHIFAVVLATVGLLVASRHPSNSMGWLFLGIAVLQGFVELCQAYGLRAAQDGLPAGEFAEWVTAWFWIFTATLLVLVVVLFPDGRLASRRWRIVPALAFAGCALAVPGFALSTDADEFAGGENPFAVQGLVIDVLAVTGVYIVLAALLASAASLFFRFRRARGVERQQLKWVASAAVVGALAMGISAPLLPEWTWPAEALTLVSIALIPIAAGIAILRHRLYDIDVVINRTLVYGALTATLALAYLGSVFLLQLALRPLTKESGLAIAASTLAVAALFRPARERIQRIVDRRFYRRKYDAARTLERFGARLRDEVDLDALGADLRTVVNDTMQPAHVSLWLRAPGDSR